MSIEPKPLEDGHWQTIIVDRKNYICDLKDEMLNCVMQNDFQGAAKIAVEITSIEDWIRICKEEQRVCIELSEVT